MATEEESLTLAIVGELGKCPGATARELAGRLRLRYPDASKSRVNGVLYRHDDLFSREANGNTWTLKPKPSVVEDDHETCVSCGVTKGISAFQNVYVPRPMCLTCEAAGRVDIDGVLGRTGAHIDALNGRRRRGVGGYVEEWERKVYITRGGSRYHFDADCSARRAGQAEAADSGQRLHKVELVSLSAVIDEREPCRICAH